MEINTNHNAIVHRNHTGYHEEERDPIPAAGLGYCDHVKGPRPGDEYIQEGTVRLARTHVTRIHAAPMTIPKTKIEDTISICR